jgi:hypothetical protein
MLKLAYTLTCDGCGKSESTEWIAPYDPWFKPPSPILPTGWKEVAGAHFCPVHCVAVKVYDDEKDGRIYLDQPRTDLSIMR